MLRLMTVCAVERIALGWEPFQLFRRYSPVETAMGSIVAIDARL